MNPAKREFLQHIQDDFFEDLNINLEGLKDFVKKAFICFGTIEVEEEIDEDGDRVLTFIDNDSADVVCAPEGVNVSDIDTSMRSVLCKICIEDDGSISMIEHGFGLFTSANKENILMAAFMIGKKVEEYEPKETE
jgi:hypothetical protein